mmetsp:Transcript_29861/g.83438  ORF Transcript_29861/g.83438 Transcript_29861/m.83438 type:complete len:229 (+) Transcript_29861:118-804(+)|eukprot:CAMPEP_0119138728 /NCGR_PEP_ID=MMETSP1310-20130426/26202_1 /TAXON_ID=464262 /ORGANISM="Genus nov. species nov., Strain RCC2339" /LENGTH=228 /DNA_ID=CAMNT_0007129951 /DNA_START=56 /DNA_END=742 /DNA_ORIENTATION=+
MNVGVGWKKTGGNGEVKISISSSAGVSAADAGFGVSAPGGHRHTTPMDMRDVHAGVPHHQDSPAWDDDFDGLGEPYGGDPSANFPSGQGFAHYCCLTLFFAVVLFVIVLVMVAIPIGMMSQTGDDLLGGTDVTDDDAGSGAVVDTLLLSLAVTGGLVLFIVAVVVLVFMFRSGRGVPVDDILGKDEELITSYEGEELDEDNWTADADEVLSDVGEDIVNSYQEPYGEG